MAPHCAAQCRCQVVSCMVKDDCQRRDCLETADWCAATWPIIQHGMQELMVVMKYFKMRRLSWQLSYLDQEGEGTWLITHGRVGALHACISPLGAWPPLQSQSLQVMLTQHPPQAILGAPIICFHLHLNSLSPSANRLFICFALVPKCAATAFYPQQTITGPATAGMQHHTAHTTSRRHYSP